MTGSTLADPVSQANASANGHNPLVAQLTHLPFTEVAKVLRLSVDRITLAWDAAVRQAMPQMGHLTFDELKDSTPQILLAIAAALASEDPQEIRGLVSSAPAQGLSRLRLNFDVVEVMQEDRLLRGIDVLPKTIVESDAELIMLVLQNLVGNAVKYSSRGTIRISSDEAPPVDRRAIWVTDEGPGIAPDKIQHIFDAFRRGEVHGQQGVGLGLAIASQGAKLLGAELSVASELNVGSSFHLIFPPSAQE